MSRNLDSLPKIKTGPTSMPSIYPWTDWTNQRIWEITCGEDFAIQPTSMVSVLRTHGKRHGLQLTARRRGDVIAFQFTPA